MRNNYSLGLAPLTLALSLLAMERRNPPNRTVKLTVSAGPIAAAG